MVGPLWNGQLVLTVRPPGLPVLLEHVPGVLARGRLWVLMLVSTHDGHQVKVNCV